MKTLTHILIVQMFFMLSPSSVHSQYFQHIVGGEQDGQDSYVLKDAVVTTDGGIVTKLVIQGSPSLIKTDPEGNMVWRKSYDHLGFGAVHYLEIKATDDGGVLLIDPSNLAGEGYGGILVMRLDEGGNVLWSKRYQIGNDKMMYLPVSLTLVRPGGFIISLSHGVEVDLDVIISINANGELQWVKQTPAGEWWKEIIAVLDDGSNGVYVVFGGFGAPTTVYRLNAQGDELWNTWVGMNNANWSYTTWGALVTQDNGVVYYGGQSAQLNRTNLIKLNENGELVWYWNISAPFPTYGVLEKGIELPNGELLIGSRDRARFAPNGQTLSFEHLSMQFGMVLGDFQHDHYLDVELENNGDIILTGRHQRMDINFNYLWSSPLMMRLPWSDDNECGMQVVPVAFSDTLVPGGLIITGTSNSWSNMVNLVVEDQSVDLPDLPLPTVFDGCLSTFVEHQNSIVPYVRATPSFLTQGQICMIELDGIGSLEIHDATGKRVSRPTQLAETHSLHTTAMTSGAYFIRATAADGVPMGTARIMIE